MLMALRTNGDLSWEELRDSLELGEVLKVLNEAERKKEKLLLKDDFGEEE